MNFSESLAERNVTKLFYVTSMHNLESILRRGILCKKASAKHNRHNISSEYMQNYRTEFHSHVPLFFTDNTPMLYVCCSTRFRNIIDTGVLAISPEATNCKGVLFFDGNASYFNENVVSPETKRYSSSADLSKLNWKIIQSRRGATGVSRYGIDWKRIRAAEIHIPNSCPASYIKGVYFQSRLSAERQAELRKIVEQSPYSGEIFLKDSLTPEGIPGF